MRISNATHQGLTFLTFARTLTTTMVQKQFFCSITFDSFSPIPPHVDKLPPISIEFQLGKSKLTPKTNILGPKTLVEKDGVLLFQEVIPFIHEQKFNFD